MRAHLHVQLCMRVHLYYARICCAFDSARLKICVRATMICTIVSACTFVRAWMCFVFAEENVCVHVYVLEFIYAGVLCVWCGQHRAQCMLASFIRYDSCKCDTIHSYVT